ncbi:MAG: hypothetical protein FWG25_04700 [Promicromonosporaceae bacterium]|nr:hypothetical protein [Promicromonosporaceae bacterium]
MPQPEVTPMTDFDLIALKRHDAAPASLIDETVEIRAQARMEQLMALPPEAGPAQLAFRAPRTVTLKAWRWLAIPVLAAIVIVVSLALPGSPTLTPAHATLASWTPIPTEFEGELGPLHEACRWAFGPDVTARTLFVDSRGDWVTIGYLGAGEYTTDAFTACLLATGEGQEPWVAMGVISFANIPVGSSFARNGVYLNEYFLTDQFAMSVTPDDAWLDPIDPTALRLIRAVQVYSSDDDGREPEFMTLVGRVGVDVVAATIYLTDVGPVEASLANGWFTAWWPPGQTERTNCLRVAHVPSEGQLRFSALCGAPSDITLPLRDGSQITVPIE